MVAPNCFTIVPRSSPNKSKIDEPNSILVQARGIDELRRWVDVLIEFFLLKNKHHISGNQFVHFFT